MTESPPLTLDIAAGHLGWPHTDAILAPKGAGAAVFADLVRGKIGRSLGAMPDALGIRLGVLMADAEAATSEPPLAIVAEFAGPVSEDTLRELLRLAWNFSHAPTLVTIEPTILKVWTCCEAPDPSRDLSTYLVQNVASDAMSPHGSDLLEAQAARALHWINLVSGQFFLAHAPRFHRDGRADQMLLGNLRHIRAVLAGQGLVDDDICHDLLARIIFVQFLFDRKDQDGKAALTPATLQRLQKEGVLAETHGSFASILSSYDDTYRLFDWLNTKFNGDLFPGKGDTDQARAVGWATEKDVVRPEHLGSLAEFIRGDVDLESRQMSLWPQYAFDVIPLEFISSIYETFVTERAAKDGIFYTPPYLVDFILDQVLPWNGTEWDLKIIDPACGSGIFLVKAFQRLVHRWKLANPGDTVRAETLRRLLERNIFGVDMDQHAVRVACFSLYLAMCDEIEPRHYWTQVTFPPMRGRRLICSDFFTEGQTGFDTATDVGSYDLVLGNAPWGDGVITEDAKIWAKAGRGWSIPNKDIGGLFLAKGSDLAAPSGRVAMIQSANSLLFNISPKATLFRQQIFGRRRIEAIFNLSALRFKVFRRKTHTTKTSAAPACVVILTPATPATDDLIRYVCPKHVRPLVDDFSILIEPQDNRALRTSDAISEPLIWSQLMWGAPRDLQLIKRLQSFPSLGALAAQRAFPYQQGLNFGDRTKAMPSLEGRRIFDETMFPADSFLTVARFLASNRPITDLSARPEERDAAIAALRGALLVVDEASLLPTRDAARLVAIANAAEVGRLVLIGDKRQLGAVEAGKPFALAQGADTAEMAQNLRATTPEMQAIHKAAQAHDMPTLSRLVRPHTTEVPGLEALTVANQWMALPAGVKDRTALFVSGRALRAEVNAEVQRLRHAAGEVGPEVRVQDTLVPFHITREEQKQAATYQPGQMMELARPLGSQGLPAGMMEVTARRKDGSIEVRLADGRDALLRPRKLANNRVEDSVRLYEKQDIRLHEGDPVRWTGSDPSRGLFNGEGATYAGRQPDALLFRDSNGREIRMEREDPMLKRIELAYALNAHQAQGATADRAIVVARATEGKLITATNLAVLFTRARSELSLVTDDLDQLTGRAARQSGEKTSAIEVVLGIQPNVEIQLQDPERKAPQREPTLEIGAGRQRERDMDLGR